MDTPAPHPASELNDAPPLLPPVLSGPAVFLWLWALPIAVMLLLNAQGYWLIEGNMDAVQRGKALMLGLAGAGNFLAGVALYAVTRKPSRRGESTLGRNPAWGLPAIMVQVAYLGLVLNSMDEILPRSVTSWIYPPERLLFNQFAFAMLPLFLGILHLACAKPVAARGRSMAVNLGMAVGAPIFLYVFGVSSSVFERWGSAAVVVAVTVAVVMGIVMFVAIIRALMVGLRGARRGGEMGQRVAILVFALCLPLGGLLLNRGIPFPVDFQAWEVYALVVANAAILCFASFHHGRRPRLSFNLLCATFPFSLYFFVVFLPYTPLSIFAVLAMGAGFLILTPTLLFSLHLYLLNQARHGLLMGGDQRRVVLAGLLCALILPGFFTVRGLADKAALNAALDYVYAPRIEGDGLSYPGSRSNLSRALSNHRAYKDGIYYPFLSDYYGWLVFDNLVLPDDKLARLEEIFFGDSASSQGRDAHRRSGGLWGRGNVRDRSRMPRAVAVSHAVEVGKLDLRFVPAGDESTVVTFALTLENNAQNAAEYLKTLPLPAGIFVNGFRLHIDGVPVPGRIFEKKTALWVYTMIRDSERRDPGLLFYNTPGELELRVFPVAPHVPAKVEIDFLVPSRITAESVTAGLKDPAVVLGELGRLLRPQLVRAGRDDLAVGLDALHLPTVEREPYLHLIIDRSVDNGYDGDLAAAVGALRKKFPAVRRARVTLANYDVADLIIPLTPLDEIAARAAPELRRALSKSGSLALDLVLAHALREHRDLDLDQASRRGGVPPQPIFVVLSRHAGPRVLALDLAGKWSDLSAGLELHELGADGAFVTHRKDPARETPMLRLGNSVRPLVASVFTGFRSTDESAGPEYWEPKTAGWLPVPEVVRPIATTPWVRAAALQLRQQNYARSPGDAGVDLNTLIAASRASGILLPAASYIVVENSAQWRMLELSERTKLNQNAALDLLETPAPPALFIALGFGLWLGVRRRWRARSVPRDSGAADGSRCPWWF